MSSFDVKTLAKYPFLPQAKEYVSSLNLTLDAIQKHPLYGGSFELGKSRILDALNGRLNPPLDDKISQEISILSFAVARILASLTNNRTVMRKFSGTEAESAYQLLLSEDDQTASRIMGEMDLGIKEKRIPFQRYLELTKDLARREPSWKLVNRQMNSGVVELGNSEPLILLREAIKLRITEPPNLAGLPPWFRETAKFISSTQQPHPALKVEKLNEASIPSCISAMLSALEAGTASHNSMFILGTFFVGLGLPVGEIVKIFSRFPNFDEEKTRYQLEFLAGEKSTTKYSCPTCAKIKSYGLCVKDCKVTHPLQFYRNKIGGRGRRKS